MQKSFRITFIKSFSVAFIKSFSVAFFKKRPQIQRAERWSPSAEGEIPYRSKAPRRGEFRHSRKRGNTQVGVPPYPVHQLIHKKRRKNFIRLRLPKNSGLGHFDEEGVIGQSSAYRRTPECSSATKKPHKLGKTAE